MRKILLLAFMLTIDILWGMEGLAKECILMTVQSRTVIPTSQETLSQRIIDTTSYRNFALDQSSEDTIHPSLRLPPQERITGITWEKVADFFTEALVYYSTNNLVKGDNRLEAGFHWGNEVFFRTALAKQNDCSNGESLITTLWNQILAIQEVPGNPTQYFQHLMD
ncbi:MAG: hypothetical protein IJ730_02725 [Alphaproteobacteria bacterium]|nr:hypothetical protein [Alphaproteobacteria bacterium]